MLKKTIGKNKQAAALQRRLDRTAKKLAKRAEKNAGCTHNIVPCTESGVDHCYYCGFEPPRWF